MIPSAVFTLGGAALVFLVLGAVILPHLVFNTIEDNRRYHLWVEEQLAEVWRLRGEGLQGRMELLDMLDRSDGEVLGGVILALGDALGDEGTLWTLRDWCQVEPKAVSIAVAKIDGAAAGQVIREMLEHMDHRVRRDALYGAVELHHSELENLMFGVFKEFILDEGWELALLPLLGQYGGPRAAQTLASYYRTHHGGARSQVIQIQT